MAIALTLSITLEGRYARVHAFYVLGKGRKMRFFVLHRFKTKNEKSNSNRKCPAPPRNSPIPSRVDSR